VKDERLKLEYCSTENMVADELTKVLAPKRHWKLIRMMGMEEWNDKGSEMDRDSQITRMRSGSDEHASSQGSHGAKGAKGLGAKWPRYQGTWLLGMLGKV